MLIFVLYLKIFFVITPHNEMLKVAILKRNYYYCYSFFLYTLADVNSWTSRNWNILQTLSILIYIKFSEFHVLEIVFDDRFCLTNLFTLFIKLPTNYNLILFEREISWFWGDPQSPIQLHLLFFYTFKVYNVFFLFDTALCNTRIFLFV